MRKIILALIVFVFTILFFAVNKQGQVAFAQKDKSAKTPIASLDNSIELAASYIVNNMLPDGRFIYERDVNPKNPYENKRYNVLRHAGTLYAMSLYEKYSSSEVIKQKRIIASEYLIKNYVKEIKPNLYAVVSKKDEESLKNNEAKLGGTGLALIGISSLYRDNKVSKEILTGLGNFILFMQKADGSFNSFYNYDKREFDSRSVSLYYPGEAALGLLYLNEVVPDKKWVQGAKKALLYLANKRKDAGLNVEYDHWAMLATSKLLETENNQLTAQDKQILKNHATLMASVALSKQITDKNNIYVGANKGNIRPCSIATYMEGDVAIYKIIDDNKLKVRLLRSIMLGTSFLANSQVKTKGATLGGIPTSADYKLKTAPKNASIIRIDNVQHTISAWITYKMLFN